MNEKQDEVINGFIIKSKEALFDAELAIKNNRLDNALNRIYYSVFYIVTALAYKENFLTSKHSQLLGWFNKKFIHEEKIFNEEFYIIYKDAFENRQNADYSLFLSYSKERLSF